MAWRRSGHKPLSEPMLTRFTDAYAALGEMSTFTHECYKEEENCISENVISHQNECTGLLQIKYFQTSSDDLHDLRGLFE